MSLDRFLRALFGHLPPGFIETRLIVEKKGGELVDRRFHASVGELTGDLDRLRGLAQANSAAVFFGVLPRRERGRGKSEDTIDGLVVWADLDFKDFTGGEGDARERLAEFRVEPSILVRSGHGLHAYWLMREPSEPELLSTFSKAVAKAIGGDHTFDAARLLRLPETFNRKDPENPLPVEIEILEHERAYNPSEMEEALDLIRSRPDARAGTVAASVSERDSSSIEASGALSERVLGLMARYPRIQTLFLGTGKPPLGRDGRRLDQSSSGYDFSLALELLKKGVTDPADLEAAIYYRPDEAAKAKGHEYIEHTVRSAIERYEAAAKSVEAGDDPAAEIDFKVQKVRIFSSDPARYELTIEGRKIVLTSRELASDSLFALRFMDAFKRIPAMPSKGWTTLVNKWLAGAETVEAPPEASDAIALREDVEQAIANLKIKDDAKDLHKGGAFRLDDETAFFRTDGLLKSMAEDRPHLVRTQLCFVLRELGWENTTRTLEGRKVRGWVGPISALDTRARGAGGAA